MKQMDACNKQLFFFLLISSAMSVLVINNVNNNLCSGENCRRARLSSDPITYRSLYRSCTSTQVGVSLQTWRPLTFSTCRPPMCASPVAYSQRVQGQVLAARSPCASRTVRCTVRTCHPPSIIHTKILQSGPECVLQHYPSFLCQWMSLLVWMMMIGGGEKSWGVQASSWPCWFLTCPQDSVPCCSVCPVTETTGRSHRCLRSFPGSPTLRKTPEKAANWV